MKNFKLLFTFLLVSTVVVASEDVQFNENQPSIDTQIVDVQAAAEQEAADKAAIEKELADKDLAEKLAEAEKALVWSNRCKAPFIWINKTLQEADDSFNKLLVTSDVKNDQGELTYAAQAQNALVSMVRRPVTTTVVAIVGYVGYLTLNKKNDTKN